MKTHEVEISTEIKTAKDERQEETTRLLEAAKEIAHKAYAPYSKFRVGAAALLDNGVIITGNNQENAAYPSGLCAERTTIFYANANYPEQKVVRLMIYAETDKGPVSTPITPCGACRQSLLEKETIQKTPIDITLAGAEDMYFIRGGVESLLPLSFVPKSLEG